MMRIGTNRAMARAARLKAAAASMQHATSFLPFSAAASIPASAAAAAPAAAVSSFHRSMHATFARLFSTNLSSGAHTPIFSSSVPSGTMGVGHPAHGAAPSVPHTTPVGTIVDPNVTSNTAHHLDNFDISAPIKAALRQNFKIENLFPVQAECYGPIVEGKDLIGRSKTGSGKTLAFVLPVVQRLRSFPPLPRSDSYGRTVMGVKTRVIILEPTRELANQVNAEILKLAHVKTAVLYGGAPVWQQAQALSRGADVIVATPGRLLDMVRRGTVSLDEVKTVVLDEADEMLRMGFDVQVEEVMSFMQFPKQVLLFSATLPSWVRGTAARYCKTPVIVDKVTGYENSTPSTISHQCMPAARALPETVDMLRDIFESKNIQRAIVFTSTKRDADAFADLLNRVGIRARELHGDVPQIDRDRTMAFFRQGKIKVLVATDVAARGLDIPNVEMVINVGFPKDPAFYVHRSGRTGRAGKSGVSLLLYMPEERSKIHSLTKEIGATFTQPTPLEANNGKTYAARSLLTSRPGMVTLQISGRADALQLENRLRALSGDQNLTVGRVEGTRQLSFVDVPESVAKAVKDSEAKNGGEADITIATQLPAEMFGGRQAEWRDNNSPKRGGGRGGGRGGYGGRGGGDRGGYQGNRDRESGGYGRDRAGGDRPSYGSRGGDRYGGGQRDASDY